MDASKALDYDCFTTKMPGLQSGMFPATSLSIVLISYNYPASILGLKYKYKSVTAQFQTIVLISYNHPASILGLKYNHNNNDN